MIQNECRYVYYETVDGDAGLAQMSEGGVVEMGYDPLYGTTHNLSHDAFGEFVEGPDGEIYSLDDLSKDEDGYYYPDDYIRFKVLNGGEVPAEDW